MLIYCDKAVESRFKGFGVADKQGNVRYITPMPKDKHSELREEAKYPAITWERIDRTFDTSRFQNGNQEVKSTSTDGVEIVELYQLANPYNIMYQIELLSKEKYDADCLEDFVDKVIRPRGDVIPIRCHIDSENIDKDIYFPLIINETKNMNDYTDSKNVYYRKIITITIKLLIDPCVLEDSSYMIKNDVLVEWLDNPIVQKEGV